MEATERRERPILFSGDMVRAILDGCKTMTRRVVKPQPAHSCVYTMNGNGDKALHMAEGTDPIFVPVRSASADTFLRCPYGKPGDLLWVRESWKATGLFAFNTPRLTKACGRFAYRADADLRSRDKSIPWRPSIHMPRWASRLTLEVTHVSVQRVQDISHGDAKAEGVHEYNGGAVDLRNENMSLHQHQFANLWDSLNAKRGYSWESNPWVWAVTFKRVEGE